MRNDPRFIYFEDMDTLSEFCLVAQNSLFLFCFSRLDAQLPFVCQ